MEKVKKVHNQELEKLQEEIKKLKVSLDEAKVVNPRRSIRGQRNVTIRPQSQMAIQRSQTAASRMTNTIASQDD